MARTLLPLLDTASAGNSPLDTRPASVLRVALVNMPWARANAPSIQCGLLKAELAAAGHQVDVQYLNLELASELGADLYASLSGLESERVHLLGEWLFGVAAFGHQPDPQEYFNLFPEIEELVGRFGWDLAQLRRLRDHTLPEWISRVAQTHEWDSYGLIGFTSTFEQNVAALACAGAIKRRHPGVRLVFGGANFEGEMGKEFLRVFPWIDFAVFGEGDVALPNLATDLAAGRSPGATAGVHSNPDGPHTAAPGVPQVLNMNLVPTPDYHDYFAALDRLGRNRVVGRRRIRLPVEFSRGCWWGAKHHCTFCGLNAASMAFRSKSADHALKDIITLVERHQVLQIDAVDNIIDMSYLTELCTAIAGRELDLRMFFEVKANLTPAQLSALARAGIRHLQPGLESLSTRVLELMRKGTTMPLNVRLLKWAKYYDIRLTWNILMGFPGESDADYYAQAELIPTLYHLAPPAGAGRLWLERYSPYFTDSSFPIINVRPKPAYQHVYPVESIDLTKIAYFFDYEADAVASTDAHEALLDAILQWKLLWKSRRPALTYEFGSGLLRLHDTRPRTPQERTLAGWRAAAFERCGDAPRSTGRITDELVKAGHEVDETNVKNFLDDCVSDRLAVTESGRYLSVAIPLRGPSQAP
jgi:ribosomal peptide maturation radical SAM protein 1